MAENHIDIMNFIYRTNKIRKIQYFLYKDVHKRFYKKKLFEKRDI